MPQLVTGRMRQPSPPACAVKDFIDTISRKWLPTAGTFEHHEQRIRAADRRPFAVKVNADRGEEPARDRHQPLMATLAIGDEHPPLPNVQILQPKTEYLATAQATEHHRQHHRAVSVRASRTQQCIDLFRLQNLRQRSRRADQRNTLARALPFPPRRQPARHRIGCNITARMQIGEQARHTRQSAAHRPRRNTGIRTD
jgi:hypothetical protein